MDFAQIIRLVTDAYSPTATRSYHLANMQISHLFQLMILASHPIALTAAPTDGTSDAVSAKINVRGAEAVGQSLTCGTAFSTDACGNKMNQKNCINLCNCNAQAKWGCQAFGNCEGSTVQIFCDGLGDCGCEPT